MADRPVWSTDDCIDVVLISLRIHRELLEDAIDKIEVRPARAIESPPASGLD